MATLKGTLTSLDGIGPLQEAVRSHIKKKATTTYKQAEASITKKVQDMIRTRLLASNVTRSLLDGKLRSDFGLSFSSAGRAVKRIIDYISDNIELSLKFASRGANVATFSLELLLWI